jgi:hypothetical protein
MWEPWIDGFTRAMGLRPMAWEELLNQADEETRTTMIFIMALQDIYTGHSAKPSFGDPKIVQAYLSAIPSAPLFPIQGAVCRLRLVAAGSAVCAMIHSLVAPRILA